MFRRDKIIKELTQPLRGLGRRIAALHGTIIDRYFGDPITQGTLLPEAADSRDRGFSPWSVQPLFLREQSFFYGESYLLRGNQAIAPAPSLRIPEAIFRELVYYFSRLSREMQVMGFIEKDEHNVFTLTELVVPPHRAGFVHANLDQDAFVPWLDLLEAEKKDITKLRFQGHSHGTLDAYFSGTDVTTIREAYTEGLVDWMVHLVGNQRGHFHARLDLYKPFPLSIGLPIMIESPKFVHTESEEKFWLKKFRDARKLQRRRS